MEFLAWPVTYIYVVMCEVKEAVMSVVSCILLG